MDHALQRRLDGLLVVGAVLVALVAVDIALTHGTADALVPVTLALTVAVGLVLTVIDPSAS